MFGILKRRACFPTVAWIPVLNAKGRKLSTNRNSTQLPPPERCILGIEGQYPHSITFSLLLGLLG